VPAAIRETVDVAERADDEYLDWYERWARDRLEPVLGPLRVIDRKGGPTPGVHDLEADLPTGMVAAIEITSEVEGARLALAASADRHLSGLRLAGSNNSWRVGLVAHARADEIRRADLLVLLRDLEQHGQRRVLNIGDYRDPFVERVRALGIESIYGWKAKPGREGFVSVGPGVYGGRGWARTAIDTWLDSFLASPQGVNKVGKLARAAHAIERHLVIVLDPFSQAGMGISLALADQQEDGSADDAIPSLVPPDPLTHVWLMPLMGTGEALCWTRVNDARILGSGPNFVKRSALPGLGAWRGPQACIGRCRTTV
jgi:hypothetical protein